MRFGSIGIPGVDASGVIVYFIRNIPLLSNYHLSPDIMYLYFLIYLLRQSHNARMSLSPRPLSKWLSQKLRMRDIELYLAVLNCPILLRLLSHLPPELTMADLDHNNREKDTVQFEKVEVDITERPVGDVETDSAHKPVPKSKFLEVQSAVDDEEDDVNMSAETFRAYVIGVFFTLLASAVSNVCELREQPLVVDSSVVQLVALPIGRWWGRYIPDKRIGFGKWSFRLNPGPFTVKEHALITAMANVGAGWPPYAVGLVIVQMVKYGSSIL